MGVMPLTDVWANAAGEPNPATLAAMIARAKFDPGAMATLEFLSPNDAKDVHTILDEEHQRGKEARENYTADGRPADAYHDGQADEEKESGQIIAPLTGLELVQHQDSWDSRQGAQFGGMQMSSGEARMARFGILDNETKLKEYGLQNGVFKSDEDANKYFERERIISSLEEWQRDNKQPLKPEHQKLLDEMKAQNKEQHDAIEQNLTEALKQGKAGPVAGIQQDSTAGGAPQSPATPVETPNYDAAMGPPFNGGGGITTQTFNAASDGTMAVPAPAPAPAQPALPAPRVAANPGMAPV